MKRRNFIRNTGALITAGMFAGSPVVAELLAKKKKILVISGWQDVNIGDIGHTPGLLHVLETYLPQTQITL